jgi:hypothetical protein
MGVNSRTELVTGLSVETVDDLAAVEPSAWDRLAAESGFYVSHAWLSAAHADPGHTPRYLLARQDAELVGALPLFDVHTEGNSFYASARHHAALTGGGNRLLAGARRGYRNGVLLRRADEDRALILRALLDAALDEAGRVGADGLVWMYVPTADAALLHEAGAALAFDTVEAVLDTTDWETYLGSFTSSRRWDRLRERRRFDEACDSGRCTAGEERLSDCWEQFAPLVASVQAKYGHPTTADQMRTVLARQLEQFGDRGVVFTARRDGDLVGGALAYEFGDTLYCRMAGFDYPRLLNVYEYFNLVYFRPIDHLARRGLAHLHLGIEAEDVKARRGAALQPLWTAALPRPGKRTPAASPASTAERQRQQARPGAADRAPDAWDVPW